MGAGKWLAYYRRAAGLTQAQLAERSGVSLRTIQEYEQDRRELTTAAAKTVKAIACAVGVSVGEMLSVPPFDPE